MLSTFRTYSCLSTGRIAVGLYGQVVSKTAVNFRVHSTKLTFIEAEEMDNTANKKALPYKGIPLHPIIPGFMIQGGDIVYGDRRGNESIYGGIFPDENFKIKHSHAA